MGLKRSSSTLNCLHKRLTAELVLRVQNLKSLRQAGELVVRAQEAVAQAVEGAYPHAAHVDGQHGGEAREHLLGRLVGERDGQDAAGRGLAVESSQAMRVVSTRVLPEPAPANISAWPAGQGDGGELFGVETVQQRRGLARWRHTGAGKRNLVGTWVEL